MNPPSPLTLALAIPLIFILVGAIGRKLIRGTTWDRSDFYFGPQLCLATFSSDALFLGELFRQPQPTASQAISGLLLIVVVFAVYIWLLSLHQDWQQPEREHRSKTQFCWLVILSNSLGTGLFAAFVFLVKGLR